MGLRSREFLAGFALCLLLFGCSHFAYKYYGLSGASFENGTLLGPDASKDLPFSVCAPTASDKSPCVVMFAREFLAMKQDFVDLQNQLVACQHGQ